MARNQTAWIGVPSCRHHWPSIFRNEKEPPLTTLIIKIPPYLICAVARDVRILSFHIVYSNFNKKPSCR